ncbi:MAG: universal stress protein [Candidatus Sedimenticola sp. PURPLELP]
MQSGNNLPKIEYKKILYVTDLSESGRHAFPHAANIAQRCQSELTVFHVVETRDLETLLGYMSEETWKELASRNLEEARQILLSRKRDDVVIQNSVQQFCEDSLPEESDSPVLAYDVKVEMGEPLEKIIEEAHGGGYDLLVISKHGHRASVKDAVMGDTARRVVRRCRIPVLVVPLPG